MLKPGTILFNKYQVLRQIGSGGMSTVYLASELGTGIRWAVKIIDKNTKEFKATANEAGTLTEIEIVKDLDHPFIPAVNDLYEEERYITIVMEYVDGCSLKDYLDKEGPPDEETAVRWCKALCEIFIYLHTRPEPVIYKDMKPANAMLKENGDIRLLDFGIAVIRDANGSLSSEKPFGTKGYASPEHFKGKVDERSDIFTLGKTLKHLLTGKSPAKGEPEDDCTIHPELKKVIEKATQPDPSLRYQSASEMLRDLVLYDKKQKKSKTWLLVLTLCIIFIAAIGIGVMLLQSGQDAEEPDHGLPELIMQTEESKS